RSARRFARPWRRLAAEAGCTAPDAAAGSLPHARDRPVLRPRPRCAPAGGGAPMTGHADPVDQIMQIMDAAFDPAYGEAWNRRQVSDALTMANCHYLLLDGNLRAPEPGAIAAGFLLSRHAVD